MSESVSVEKCPYCGGLMEKGFLFGRGIYWWHDKNFPLLVDQGEPIDPSARLWQRGTPHLEAQRCLKCKIILIRAPEMGTESDKKPEDLYEKLLQKYNMIYGTGKQVLELKIKSIMKERMSREQAIIRLAKKEGVCYEVS